LAIALAAWPALKLALVSWMTMRFAPLVGRLDDRPLAKLSPPLSAKALGSKTKRSLPTSNAGRLSCWLLTMVRTPSSGLAVEPAKGSVLKVVSVADAASGASSRARARWWKRVRPAP
jgi:hypothetical protein